MKRKIVSMNTITFEQDPYTSHFGNEFNIDFPQEEVVNKSYNFEVYDDDIIKSPISHKVKKCTLDITITDEKDIDGLLKFLENLRPTLIKEETK